jgi:Holliday junction resolvase RusA-like endonuclease
VQFDVPGMPAQQGSKTGFVVGKRAILVDANEKKLKPYRGAIQDEARKAMNGELPFMLPCEVSLVFTYPWLKMHLRADGTVKAKTPWKSTQPDLDKLCRAAIDSLTGIVYKDDGQVYQLRATKMFGATASTSIRVSCAIA